MQDLEDEQAEDEEAADPKVPKRPGADKRKLADAFERERNKQQRAKDAAVANVRARTCIISALSRTLRHVALSGSCVPSVCAG